MDDTRPPIDRAIGRASDVATDVATDGAAVGAQVAAEELMIRCRSLVQVYRVGGGDVLALQGLDLDVRRGEMLGVVGASGSGKSTLLSVVGGLLAPTAGEVVVDGIDLVRCSRRRRERYRRERVGFVWQHSAQNLLADLTARENVERPLVVAGRPGARRRAEELLERVGLGDRASHRPTTLSGGEQARVALAVALATEPAVLLADEPTGELDRATSADVFELMRDISATTGVTQVVVSHDPDLVDHVDRVVGIRDGRTSTELRRIDDDVEHVLVVDEVGRVQLPLDAVDALDVRGGVTVRVEGGSIVLR
ncbi:MAG: ABC transporter ATP-binding protein, partial [Actinomycetota bacterium]